MGGKVCALVAGLVLIGGLRLGASRQRHLVRHGEHLDHLGHRHRVQLHEPTPDDDVRPQGQRRQVEHWTAELITNPSMMARQG